MVKKIICLLTIFLLILIGGAFAKSKLPRKETEHMEENNLNITKENTVSENSNNIEETTANTVNSNNDNNTNKTETAKNNTQSKEIFTSSEIPNNILQKMIGNSIPTKDKDKVNIKQLVYLKITYWGFDEKTHVGEMVVSKTVAQEVLDIFEEAYHKKYPIEKIKLIDEYGANDEKSMANNNTSAFCYRVISNTNKISKHSLGKAIDVNPLYNPYVVGNSISPANGKEYANRSIERKGIIKKGDDLYNAFIKRGWTWGGNWSSKKDYQHFEKN